MNTPIAVEPPAMALALSASFGSLAQWRADAAAVARTLGSAQGHLQLVFDAAQGRLVHQAVAAGAAAPAGSHSVLALDLPLSAAALDSIVWASVYGRYQQAVHASSDGLAADPQRLGAALVVDVRRDVPFLQAKTLLPGASWRDPAQVGTWAAGLPRDREVVVYCIHGHEVSRSTALRLRAAGVDARFLPGGIDAWTQAGRPLQMKAADA